MVPRPGPLALLLLACAAAGAARPRAALAQRIAEIQIAPSYLRMRQDAVTRISATAYDADGKPIDVPFRWQSSNINVVVVDSLGNVRAVAPGGALVTASTDDAGRRRRGQVTVVVMRELPVRPPGARGFPPPGAGAPGMPPAGAAPGMPPGMPPEMPHAWAMDSATRASINCAEPMINAVNPMRACWDVRAALRDSVSEPERSGPERCMQGASPVSLLVQVTETGDVGEVHPFAPSSCPEFTERVAATVRRLHFTPALRAGKPVSSWRMLRMRGR